MNIIQNKFDCLCRRLLHRAKWYFVHNEILRRSTTLKFLSINIMIACGVCFILSAIAFGDSFITRHFDKDSNNTGYSKKSPDGSYTRYYDRSSNYTGYSRAEDSKTRYYDSKGDYTGYSINDLNRHTTKYYNRSSSYTGYSTTDMSGKTRFFDKKGNFTGYYIDE